MLPSIHEKFLMEEVLIMDAALASLLAPLPSSISSKFDRSLTKQSEKTLSESSRQLATNLAPAPGETLDSGDRVTILGNSPPSSREGSLLADLSTLYSPTSVPGSGTTALAGAQSQFVAASFSSFESFSFQASFTHLTLGTQSGGIGLGGGPGGGKAIGHLLQELDTAFQGLMALSPGQGKRLGILARMLAALNPKHSEKMLQTIFDSISRLSGLGQSAPPPQPAPAAPPADGQSPPSQEVTTEMVHFSLDFEMERSIDVEVAIGTLRDGGIEVTTAEIHATQRIQIHIEFTGIRQEVRQSDPLVLDLQGDGVNLTGIEDGVQFDIDADGKTDRLGFVQGDDAFLALDRNGNGRIDDGRELFGDQHGEKNGFEERARFDDKHDDRIDAKDAIYSSLRLLHDRDGDGRVGMTELSTLSELGVEALELAYAADDPYDDDHGNTLAERSAYLHTDGSRRELVDAWIGYA